MKVLFVICVVVLLLQFGALGLSFSTGGGDQPSEEEIEDGDWDPKEKVPVATRFDRLLDPFRPRLDLPWRQKSFPGGSTEEVAFGNGHEDRRVAEFELTGGAGVLIRYECSIFQRGYRCPQITCLCPAGAPINPQDFSACEGFGNTCPADGNIGAIVVYSETGDLQFSGLGLAGGAVRQR